MFQDELDSFMMNLQDYFVHLEKNPNSLIARIYGIYQVSMKGIVPVNFMVMANTINSVSRPLKCYDLKGSTVNRVVARDEKGQTMKDLNLLNAKNYRLKKKIKGLLQFKNKNNHEEGGCDIQRLMTQIEKDNEFLQERRFIDYSVLLAIEKRPQFQQLEGEDEENKEGGEIVSKEGQKFIDAGKRHMYYSKCGRYIYHIAIIDFLVVYNVAKFMENWAKTRLLRRDPRKISAVDPKIYGPRFVEFMRRQVFVNEETNMVYNRAKKKEQAFKEIAEPFFDMYHDYYLCHHCGKTYNDKTDPRITLRHEKKPSVGV